MTDPLENAAAIVGVSAILPDAPDAAAFWRNVTGGRYSITDVGPERWDPELYYDPDPKASEKTYSKIGGWVREWEWDPFGWKLPVPPRVAEGMDDSHKWAVACARMALMDAGWPDRPLDLDRTAVIIGNALSGEKHYLTALRIMFPELARELERTASFAALPPDVRTTIERELRDNFESWLPVITEDTMPGELGNCIAGRVANLFNLHGPNFTTDAACASALAAMDATVGGLLAHEFDVAITGGIDRNMGAHTFVKFCAIGALSPTGTRPYSEDADGFVMGEGAALFVVKRLADAVKAEDRIYAVVRGVGSASDGKGKGITAPNPVGQRFAVERAWRNSGLSPAECTLIEGHGTSTSVGDAVELNSLTEAFAGSHVAPGSIALGSVKSNIGHLKGGAGAAGMLKATLALHEKVLPPSINFERPNPNLDWAASPFAVNTELRDWGIAPDRSRVAGVSAFGFGGTNFHLVMEEYAPDRHATNGHRSSAVVPAEPPRAAPAPRETGKPSVRGALVLGAADGAELANALRTALAEARQGRHLEPTPPSTEALRAPERIAIDYADGPDLVAKAELASRVLQSGNQSAWPALRARGIHRGSGSSGKVAFLFTGQGSQYVNMIAELRRREPVVAELFEEADAIMAPLLEGRRLSDVVFADPGDEAAMARAEDELRRTEIQQPTVITVDTALARLLGEYGVTPDLVMGHSVGEYAALVAAGALTFGDALEAVSARGREMASLRVDDPGAMAAVIAPLAEVEEIVDGIDGYAVLANMNSMHQVVVGGATHAVAKVVTAVQERGHTAIPLPVSHAFHTEIVAPASGPLRAMLERLGLRPPQLPIVANVTGEFYPSGDGAVGQMLEILSRQIASPVQFVKGLRTLYDEGARVIVEVGPKHALQGFASDVLGDGEVVSLASNHPKQGDIPTFNNALCGLWAAGLGAGREPIAREHVELRPGATAQPHPRAAREARARRVPPEPAREASTRPTRGPAGGDGSVPEPVVITGAALGLPGAERLFDDANLGRLLDGEQGIDVLPGRLRRDMLDKHITRLVKRDDGGASFETIDRLEGVIKLAARAGAFDPVEEFGIDAERLAALGHDTQLAIAAGIDTLRDAGIPLVLRYKTTTKGTKLPDRWSLPDELRDDTGVIYASAFPGLEELADEVARYTTDHMRRERLTALETLRARMLDHEGTDPVVLDEVERRIHDLSHEIEENGYTFDRRFLFRVLSMGHSQLAELIGARGPNTQINSACASTTQAVALAEDWIRAGRCRRVLIVAADDATSDTMMGWIGAGFLASGAAATDEVVEEAALPFDRRRHGMIIGMGAAGLMVESAEAARERAMTPICDVLGSVTANSAFHGTRLDVEHISGMMERLVEQAESRGIDRGEIAGETVFVSHETYTPARGGSAAAEIHALRDVFGELADRIVIANVKGFTGHPMGVGLEDVLAVKALETGVVPPVPNLRDPDLELGALNLSGGGAYPVRYALRLAAGFGSQISMLLLGWTPVADGRRRNVDELGYHYRIADRAAWTAWLQRVSGYEEPQLEISQHRLRVADQGPPAGIRLERAPVADVAPAEIEPAVLEAESAPAAVEPPAPEPAPAPAQAPTPAEPAPAAELSEQQVRERILEIVAEQTGYPPDLLDPELDLEADLGIDTVKQAEVFATIREAYGIERDDALKLRDYPTLNHAVGFVLERAPRGAAEPAPAPAPEPAPAPAQAPTPAEPAPAAELSEQQVRERILEIVAEQTGYPPDLLDPELDLEADLGIDTVKQAEVFATIREAYGIERDDALKLRDYPTLNHAVGFVLERAGAPEPASLAESAAPEPEPEPEPAGEAGERFARRVPVALVRPPLEQCATTGIALGEDSRVVLRSDRGGVGAALAKRLSALGVEVLEIADEPGAEELEERLKAWSAEGPVQGVYWLAALDDEGPLDSLDPAGWREGLRTRVKLLAATMRALSDQPSPTEAFLVAATRLGGRFGYDAAGPTSVMGGAVAGFAKALAREREHALIKVVDFEPSRKTAGLAETLISETLRDPGAVEIGHAGGLRWTVGLREQAVEPDSERALTKDTTFVVTGAAGSIVAAITADLAVASGGTFHLLDLVPEPDPDDPDLERFASDREGLKLDLADRIKQRGERPTPKLVERELARIERARAALDSLEAIREAGGTAHWHQVDLTDPAQVAQALGFAAEGDGVGVLIHAAGTEVSHFLGDKPQAEYDLVFNVKADGWFNLLHALRDVDVRTALVFSSIAGRFGNAGQTDYSAANDLMCKSVLALGRGANVERGIAIDWTAWAEIGMATRGSVPKMMEMAGIDMLPPDVGVPAVRHELTAAGAGGEVVIAGSLGVMATERHPNGGIDPEEATKVAAKSPRPMTGRVAAMRVGEGLSVLVDLDPGTQAFLDDHRIDGTPVLPGVMGIEAFAEAATALLPSWHVVAVEDVDMLAPVKFYRDDPRTLEVRALLRDGGDGTLLADCALIGRREIRGQGEQESVHFTGRVRLTHDAPPAPPTAEGPPGEQPDRPVVRRDAVYRVYFHGPAYQVLDRAWRSDGEVLGQLALDLPPDHEPPGQPMEMAPRLIELCFQTAGVYELGTAGRMALPTHVDRVTSFAGEVSGPVWAVVRPRDGHDGVDAEVVDDSGRVRVRLEGYRTIEVPGAEEDEALEPLRAAMR
jgi:acyl transferase domain-containing protein/acyl carrier protein